MLQTTDCHPLLATEVRGLDLSASLPPDVVSALKALWDERLVLIFPGQAISDDEHIAFGRRFGALETHPSLAHRSSQHAQIYRVSNIDEAGNIIPAQDSGWQYLSQSWRWHSDSSFRAIPSIGSILHGIETTRRGGNTLFANLYAAYDALPHAMRRRIESLVVVHDHDFILSQIPDVSARKDKGTYDPLPPVRHPLVRLHPSSGRRSLFLSPHTMASVEGMPDRAGRALLDELIAHATQDEFVYTHRWTDDDIVMWDNRCTMHSVQPFDNANIRRIMHRVTLVGEEAPIGVH
ncbi:MAG: TauD/TfdA family dioxygenase [Gammaproteobacteria bacterium]|nr:TauD/TfdA family dioxygenase [Gammaproteobacteria bacterium]